MQKFKCMVVVLAALMLTVAVTETRAQTPKLGVFDPQQVSANTDVGKRVQAELTAFRDLKQTEINDKEQQISRLQKELSAQELSLSPDRRNNMEKDIRRKMLDLEAARESATRELQLEVAAAQNSFEEKLIVTVETFGREEGFTLILDRGLVAWADASVDLTTAIIDRFNALFPPATGGSGD